MLGPELTHDLGQLVVHVLLDAASRLNLLWRFFANNLCTYRPLGGEHLGDGLRLEAHHGLGNHRVEHAAGSLPRLRAVFVLQAQQLDTLGVRLLPVLATGLVVVNVAGQLACKLLQVPVVHQVGQVCAKVVLVVTGADGDVQLPHVDIHFFRVNNLNLNRFFILGKSVHAERCLI